MNRALRILSAGALLLAPAFGYTRSIDPASGVAVRRIDSKGIQYYINDQIVPGATSDAVGVPLKVVSDGSDPVTAIRAAFASWNNLPGTDVKFLPLKTTSSFHSPTDGKDVVTFAKTADDLSVMGFSPGKLVGAFGLARVVSYQSDGVNAAGVDVKTGDIADADILLNSSVLFTTDGSVGIDMQSLVTHEIGHVLGENHSAALGATMFPLTAILTPSVGGYVSVLGQRLVSADDRQFVAAVYPASNATPGTLSGKVTLGGSPAKNVLVTILDPSNGVLVNTLTATDGSYAQKVAAGNYLIYAEPFNSIVAPGNLYLRDSDVTGGFLPTFFGGVASPTSVKVAAGATSSADLTLATGTNSLSYPFIATGTAGGKGDVKSLGGILTPLTITSGQPLDIALLAGGVDGTVTVQVYGGGVTVRSGSTRVDTSVNFPAGPLVRTTLDIPARETASLATLVITKGSSVLVVTGIFLIVPPKPVFTSKSVVNAASYVGLNGDGVVSPGGLYTIYAATGSALGPVAYVANGPYDGYGKLANSLANVSVTFDGVPAPMFFSFSGQLNVQVPFEVAGRKTTQVQVTFAGSASDKITVPVAASQPAFFTLTAGGSDSLAYGAPDFALNTATNPVARGGVVVLYGTGLGKVYDVPTGAGAGAPPAGYTGGNSCTIGGTKATPAAYTGWVFGFVGLAQWNVSIPADSPTGKVTVACTDANGNSTQTGTLYIK